jgi:hypothetical protein
LLLSLHYNTFHHNNVIHSFACNQVGMQQVINYPGVSEYQCIYLHTLLQVIDTTFDAAAGPAGLLPALKDVQAQAAAAIAEGYSFICLSDRAFGPARVPIPILLATGAVHHQLVSMKRRTQVGLLIETGEVRWQLFPVNFFPVHDLCAPVSIRQVSVQPLTVFSLPGHSCIVACKCDGLDIVTC